MTNPDELLAALGKVSGEINVLDTDRDAMVLAARKAGASWTQIGKALGGISKQSAWERYRHLEAS
jgi:hypothetical protein